VRGVRKQLIALVVAALLAAGLAACGGDDDSGSAETSASNPATSPSSGSNQSSTIASEPSSPAKSGKSSSSKSKTASGEGGSNSARSGAPNPAAGDTSASFTPPSHSDSFGGAGQFHRPGGDNSIQTSGSEASSSELQQAAAALHGYLDASAAGAWRDACSYMASGAAVGLRRFAGNSPQLKDAGCPELLAALSAGTPESTRRLSTEADVASLRVDGDRGSLLFQGAHNTDYFMLMPMAKEDGEWKVAAVAASAIPY